MPNSNSKSGSRTLLWSVIMSAPGPLVVGLGLLTGRSSTQIADFARRSAELLAIIMSFVIYKITTRNSVCHEEKRLKLEQGSNAFVGTMMCIGGSFMILLALMSETTDKGNVIPGLAIAVLGVIANTAFWWKYTHLNRAEPNAILLVQIRLYRAKSLVDGCVTVALLSVVIAPASPVSFWLDFVGSLIVALYLIWCGSRTIWEATKRTASN
ncbi:MAG TPA: cation transporter [Anaerolineales bacterium]|nr:cation transporter [Anaerolineales bacterium]